MESVLTPSRADEVMGALRRARRRLVGTLWISVVVLLVSITAWGLYAEWEVVSARFTAPWLLIQMSQLVRWCAAAPVVLLIVVVLTQRSRTRSRLALDAVTVLLLLFSAGVGASLTLRWMFGQFPQSLAGLSFLAFNWFAYDLMVFSIILAAGYLIHLRVEQLEASVRLDEMQSRLEEESSRASLTVEQSIVLVQILRQIADTCAENPRRATTRIVDLGDLLRSLLSHLQRESVDLEDEVELYDLISAAREESDRITVEVIEGDDLEPLLPGSVLVPLFRVHRFSSGRLVAELLRERSSIVLRLRGMSSEEEERLLDEMPEGVCRRDGVVECRIRVASRNDDEMTEPEPAAAVLGTDGSVLIAIPLLLGLSIGLASAASRWIGVQYFATNVEMNTLRIAAAEYSEWIIWGLIGSLSLMMARRARWAKRWVVGALAVWFLVGHLGIATGIAVLYAPPEYPLLSVDSITFYLLRSLLEYDLGLRVAVLLIGGVMAIALTEADRLVEGAAQERAVRDDERLARIRALRAQLQPHFLLNSLHTIVPLLEDDPEEAARAVQHLGELIDTSQRLAMAGLVPLEAERAMACRFLQALTLRFGDRLRLDIDVSDDLGDVLVPALISQPLLENALVHGIERTSEASWLSLRVVAGDDRLWLEIRNSISGRGGGIERGIGTRNTIQALELCYGNDYRFESFEEENQWVSRVDIPLRRMSPSAPRVPVHAAGCV